MSDFLYKFGRPDQHFSSKSMEENSDWLENKQIPAEFLHRKLDNPKQLSGYESFHIVKHPALQTEHVDKILKNFVNDVPSTERFLRHANEHGNLLTDEHVDHLLKTPSSRNLLLSTTSSILKPKHLDELVKSVSNVQLPFLPEQDHLQPHHIDHILDRMTKFSPNDEYYRHNAIYNLALGNHNLMPHHVSTLKKLGDSFVVKYIDKKYPNIGK